MGAFLTSTEPRGGIRTRAGSSKVEDVVRLNNVTAIIVTCRARVGAVEHWIEQEKRTLAPGDSVFMPARTVHANFNIGAEDAKVIAILGPCVGDAGVEQVDVEAPWNGLGEER